MANRFPVRPAGRAEVLHRFHWIQCIHVNWALCLFFEGQLHVNAFFFSSAVFKACVFTESLDSSSSSSSLTSSLSSSLMFLLSFHFGRYTALSSVWI